MSISEKNVENQMRIAFKKIRGKFKNEKPFSMVIFNQVYRLTTKVSDLHLIELFMGFPVRTHLLDALNTNELNTINLVFLALFIAYPCYLLYNPNKYPKTASFSSVSAEGVKGETVSTS